MAHNPYLEEFRRLLKGHESPYYFDLELRHDTIMQYAWAIPNEPALKALAGYRKIVEIGAGGGYWAHLLAQRGAEVACYDLVVPPSEWAARQWHPIHIGGPERAADHPEAALLLCRRRRLPRAARARLDAGPNHRHPAVAGDARLPVHLPPKRGVRRTTMLLAEVVARTTPESLDADLAALAPDTTVNMNEGDECFLHLLWSPLVDGRLVVHYDGAVLYADLEDRHPDTAPLPRWLGAWQETCVNEKRHWRADEARTVLARVAGEGRS